MNWATHFIIRQNVLYSQPSKASRVVDYLKRGALLQVIDADQINGWALAQSETNKVGFTETIWLEPYRAPFDELSPALRRPQDSEIAQALAAGRAAQYIRLDKIGIKRVHYNLCGQFCAAAVMSMDVMFLLEQWLDVYPRAKTILNSGTTTGFSDLLTMLHIGGWDGKVENFQYPSPGLLQEAGLCIAGVGINSQGKILFGGGIRHWVVVLDVEQVANTAWVWLYNPVWNRHEAYLYDELLERNGRLNILKLYAGNHARHDAGIDAGIIKPNAGIDAGNEASISVHRKA